MCFDVSFPPGQFFQPATVDEMLELTSALAWVAEQRRSDGGDSDRLLALVLDGLRPPRDLHPNVTADG